MPFALAVGLLLPGAALSAQAPAGRGASPADRALPNDNTRPAGRRVGRVVRLALEPRAARWTPVAGDDAQDRPVLAWAEAGGAPSVPGPLVRARVGDTLAITVRNPLGRALHVVGLGDPGSAAARDTLHVPAGDSAAQMVVLTRAGSFWYDAATTHPADRPPRPGNPFPDKHHQADETLVGGFVVDEADAPADVAARERVFVIHVAGIDSAGGAALRAAMARRGRRPDLPLFVNGAAWPATERLRYAVGDTVRWRVLNVAFLPHPMHLHGFYFRVDARGDAHADTAYAPADRRMAVTELLDGFTSARLTWTPDRPGNWLFHCHLLNHMAPRRLPAGPGAAAAAAPNGSPRAAHATHGVADHTADHMAGLVLGVHVTGRAARPHAAAPRPAAPPRRLTLWVTERRDAAGAVAGAGYVLQRGARPPARDSVTRPGTPIELTRGRPVAITVRNARPVPVSVHWHGMELESRYDGVGGWSGAPGNVTPPVAPGDSFVVRFTPPRAGTFIYHTHDEQHDELARGHYGALLVHAPGRPRDPARDHLVVLGAGPRDPAVRRPPVPYVNADTGAAPLALAPGVPNRLRLVNIGDNDLKWVRLVDSAGAPLRWRVVGKDGWTPPPHQRHAARPAALLVGVGETYDVEVAAEDARRAAALLVETRYYPGSPRVAVHEARVPVRTARDGARADAPARAGRTQPRGLVGR